MQPAPRCTSCRCSCHSSALTLTCPPVQSCTTPTEQVRECCTPTPALREQHQSSFLMEILPRHEGSNAKFFVGHAQSPAECEGGGRPRSLSPASPHSVECRRRNGDRFARRLGARLGAPRSRWRNPSHSWCAAMNPALPAGGGNRSTLADALKDALKAAITALTQKMAKEHNDYIVLKEKFENNTQRRSADAPKQVTLCPVCMQCATCGHFSWRLTRLVMPAFS